MTTTVITILCFCLTAFSGIFLGSVKVRGISIGSGGVLFAGLILGYFLNANDVVLEPNTLGFLREFGLILFIYSMGLTVGPNIFSSLKRNGIVMNAIALAVVVIGSIVTCVIGKFGFMVVAVGRTVFGGGYQHAGFGCGAADFGGIGFDPRQSGAKQHDVRHGVPDYDCLHDLRFRVFEIPVPREHHG